MRTLFVVVGLAGCIQEIPVFDRVDAGTEAGRDAATDAPLDGLDAGEDASPPRTFGQRLSAGLDHACQLDLQGGLRCWGSNASGQLGVGDTDARTGPVSVPGRWFEVGAGGDSTCAIDQDRRVWCWGANDEGALGQGDRTSRSTPVEVNLGGDAEGVDVGLSHACALRTDGVLLCWGQNAEGQLAQGDSPLDPIVALAPIEVPGGPWERFTTGDGHVCAIDRGGVMSCWGRNTDSELGFPSSESTQEREPRIVAGRTWLSVAAAQFHTCGIDSDNQLLCWGRGSLGRTGQGEEASRTEPTLVASDSSAWRAVDANWFSTCGVRLDGSLWCWGWNEQGQLGTGDRLTRLVPTAAAVDGPWTSVAVGRFFACALGPTVSCTGRNGEGQLGRADPVWSEVFLPQ
ncbi:MAG: hypothetical protein AAGE52_21030 [Myxococcota bacterium]